MDFATNVALVAKMWKTVEALTAVPKGALTDAQFDVVYERIQAHVRPHLDSVYSSTAGFPVPMIEAIWAFDRLALISAIGIASKQAAERSRSARARAAAARRHIENHAMRAQVFEWLDENMKHIASFDAAADAIAGKVVPVKWRTARDWVALWRKVRSASRP